LDPKLTSVVNGARYDAACAAVLAGCGRGEDPTRLTEEERDQFRKQALRWLTDDLAGLSGLDARGLPADQILGVVRRWQQDPNLARVRDEPEAKTLPETEQAEGRKFWADVAALQNRAETRLAGSTP